MNFVAQVQRYFRPLNRRETARLQAAIDNMKKAIEEGAHPRLLADEPPAMPDSDRHT